MKKSNIQSNRLERSGILAYDGILLTEEQRKGITSIPHNISEWEIVKYYTFSDFDIEVINNFFTVNKHVLVSKA